MLYIIGMILKIIGILLLMLLGILLILLIAPFGYQINASKDEQSAAASGKISWLFHIVTVRFFYSKEGFDFAFKIFGIHVLKKGKKKTPKRNTSRKALKKEDLSDDFHDTKDIEIPKEKEIEKKQEVNQETVKQSEEHQRAEKKVTVEQTKEHQRTEKKVEETVQNSESRMERLRHQAEAILIFLRRSDVQQFLKKMWNSCKKLFRHLLPNRFRLELHFGFDDPALTGQVLGLFSVFYAWYLDRISLQPDFEKEILEGKVWMRGRMIPAYLLYILLRSGYCVWKNKSIFNSLRELREELIS